MKTSGIHILFLDGECLLCRRTAYLLHRLDRSKKIRFSTLQGETAEMLPPEWRTLTDDDGIPSGNVILAECTENDEARYWEGANAILRALKLSESWVSPCWIFYYLPETIKNALYRMIARKRHELRCANSTCPAPTQSFKDASLP